MSMSITKRISKKHQQINDDFQEEQSALEALDLDRQSNCVEGKSETGKYEAPRTDCWKRFDNKPFHHALSCGHLIVTESMVACCVNCRLSRTAKYAPHGTTIKCPKCIERRKQAASLLLPRKNLRRHSNAVSSMAKMEVDASKSMFAESSATVDDDEDSFDLFRQQLIDAGYERRRRSSIIEEALPRFRGGRSTHSSRRESREACALQEGDGCGGHSGGPKGY
jgi:hypothetical protein